MAVPAALLIIGMTTLVESGGSAYGDVPSPSGCITATESTRSCPPDSPQISAASPGFREGVTPTGTVYQPGSNPITTVSDLHLNAPIVAMAGGGVTYLAASDGGVFAINSPFFGSMGGVPLNAPVVGIAASNDGYWLVASDGGVFAFGDARFFGSMGGVPLNSPIVGMAASSDGNGYWLVAADGGVFAFGDAFFYGSLGGEPLSGPIVGMSRSQHEAGYLLVGSDGGVFAYGDAVFLGSFLGLGAPMLAIGIDTNAPGPGPPGSGPPPPGYCVATKTAQVYCYN